MEGYKPLANGECNPYSIDKETNYVRYALLLVAIQAGRDRS